MSKDIILEDIAIDEQIEGMEDWEWTEVTYEEPVVEDTDNSPKVNEGLHPVIKPKGLGRVPLASSSYRPQPKGKNYPATISKHIKITKKRGKSYEGA